MPPLGIVFSVFNMASDFCISINSDAKLLFYSELRGQNRIFITPNNT